MTERKAGIIDTIKFAKETFDFTIEQANEGRYFYDRYPLSGLEKIFWIISHLKPERLKELIHEYSSYNYGWYIFDVVFPRFKNPEDFHSTEFEICLTDNPVQVLGWKETEELVQQGVAEEGLDEDWINIGFEKRALERGIDLEWHFFSEPRNISKQNSVSNVPLVGK